jgi:2-polyprenyl-3-methyl-5-hydroxy-6-metoxy-1,4-benzoquinol methylase
MLERMTEPSGHHWERVYGEKEEASVSWFQERPKTSLDLIARTAVGLHARIIDVGGGASRLADALLESGHRDITVLDIAEAALAKSRARLASQAEDVSWIASDLRDWKPESSFDVWHDRAVFHFMVTDDDRRAYLSTLRQAVRHGGHVIIATFGANGPEKCSGLPVQRYEPEGLAAVLGSEFSLVESVREEHLTPAKKVQSFQFSRFSRAK